MTLISGGLRPKLRFRRQELKYWIDIPRQNEIRERLLHMMRPDAHAGPGEYGAYRIDSLYLEAPDQRCYDEKLAGLEQRRKFRFRTYGEPSEAERVFVEIKRKANNTILKSRVPLSREEFQRYWDVDQTPESMRGGDEGKILESFTYFRYGWSLQPTTLVSYWREAYQADDDDRVRVTFDQRLRCAACFDVNPEKARLIECQSPSRVILEIKLTGYMPEWLYRVVRDYDLQSEAISKYCLAAEEAETASSLVALRPV